MKGFRHLTRKYIDDRVIVDDATGCWVWQLCKSHDGYGMSYIVPDATIMAHRVAYLIAHGEIPEGLTLDHLCRNRPCVNPDHLEPVTIGENTLRSPFTAPAINAGKTHCPQLHPYDEANTYLYKGRRGCRACNRAAVARYSQRKRRAMMGGAA